MTSLPCGTPWTEHTFWRIRRRRTPRVQYGQTGSHATGGGNILRCLKHAKQDQQVTEVRPFQDFKRLEKDVAEQKLRSDSMENSVQSLAARSCKDSISSQSSTKPDAGQALADSRKVPLCGFSCLEMIGTLSSLAMTTKAAPAGGLRRPHLYLCT